MQTEQQSLRAAAGQRFWQIDALRGLALLNMLVYHAMYDWVYIFGHASAGTTSGPRTAMCGSSISAGALFCSPATALRWPAAR